MEVVVTTGAIRRAKLQSNHHHQQTNTQVLQAGYPSCRQTNSVKALKVKMPSCNYTRETHDAKLPTTE